MMGKKTTAHFDTRQFDRALKAFGKDAGVAVHDSMRDQIRIFTQAVIRSTPPKTVTIGNKRIEKDVKKVLGEISSISALNEFKRSLGRRFWPLEFEAGLSVAEAHAEKYRTKQGRVKYKADELHFSNGTKWSKKMHTTKRNRNAIIRNKKKKVGQAKAGWMAAARRFGARGIPGWVSRHSAQGDAADTFNERSGKGFVEAVNKVPHASRHTGIVSSAMRGRVRAMTKQINARLSAVGAKHSAR